MIAGPTFGTTGRLCHVAGRGDEGAGSRLDRPRDLDDPLAAMSASTRSPARTFVYGFAGNPFTRT
jgi:hypothetical protein